MAVFTRCGSVYYLVLPYWHVSNGDRDRRTQFASSTHVPYHTLLHDILVYVLADGCLSAARRCNRDQHLCPAILTVAHILWVRVHHTRTSVWTSSLTSFSVLVSPSNLPRFWIFMYRATPITYFVSTLVSTGVAGVNVMCSLTETLTFDPGHALNCSSYLSDYISRAGGHLLNPEATQDCHFYPVSRTDDILATSSIQYNERWRNFAITLVFSLVNILGAMILYWLFRVPKGARSKLP